MQLSVQTGEEACSTHAQLTSAPRCEILPTATAMARQKLEESSFVWTMDNVELLLNIILQYKAKKTMENVKCCNHYLRYAHAMCAHHQELHQWDSFIQIYRLINIFTMKGV